MHSILFILWALSGILIDIDSHSRWRNSIRTANTTARSLRRPTPKSRNTSHIYISSIISANQKLIASSNKRIHRKHICALCGHELSVRVTCELHILEGSLSPRVDDATIPDFLRLYSEFRSNFGTHTPSGSFSTVEYIFHTTRTLIYGIKCIANIYTVNETSILQHKFRSG